MKRVSITQLVGSYTNFRACFVVRSKKKKADAEWLKTVLTSGTISDKLSARTLLIQVMSNMATIILVSTNFKV